MKRETLILNRKNRNKTQQEVAADLGISAIYLRKLEAGTANPGRDIMINVERYYGVSMRDLFPDIFLPDVDTKCINK
jgi:transcriptional regulator with XRE-family HTH domain